MKDEDEQVEELDGSGTVSTIVGSSTEETGFVNVMKILEEERYCMERRLDLITKVGAYQANKWALVVELVLWAFS